MTEKSQEFGTSVITKGRLELIQKSLGKCRKGDIGGRGLINIPLINFTCKRRFEQPKMDRVIGNGVR